MGVLPAEALADAIDQALMEQPARVRMAERWIKLRLHPDHPRVAALASAMGVSPAFALVAAVRWFFYLDRCPGVARMGLTSRQVDAVAGSGFCRAGRTVGWLKWTGSQRNKRRLYVPVDADKYLSDAARLRKYREKTGSERRTNVVLDKTRTEQSLNEDSRSTANHNLTGDELTKARQMLRQFPIAKHNQRAASEMLDRLDDPWGVMKRITRNVLEKRLRPVEAAGYVFNALKSETEHG